MFSAKRPYQFQDNITVDFLQTTYMDHQQIAEELALSEIHSLELAMPIFNTLASLNKAEFNKLMTIIKRKFIDTATFTVMVAAISDTFTCMIQNNKFYESYAGDNKIGLELLMSLLQTIKLLLVTYHRAIEKKQLETLIVILEKSSERIQNEKEHYEIMRRIIFSLKTLMQNQLGSENETEMQEVAPFEHVKKKPKLFFEDVVKENTKLPSPVLNNNNNVISNVGCKMDSIKIERRNSPVKPSVQKQVNKSSSHVAPLKSQDNNKKPANAFELMMMSSKLMRKRKVTT